MCCSRLIFYFAGSFCLFFLSKEPLSASSNVSIGRGCELVSFLLLALVLLGGYALWEHARRKQAEHFVVSRRDFETFVSRMSSELINTSPTQIGSGIQKSLIYLRQFLGIDRVSIYKLTDKESKLRLQHSARAEGVPPAPDSLNRREFWWLFERFLSGEPTVISSMEGLPAETTAERSPFGEFGGRTIVVFPIRIENRLEGILSFALVGAGHSWPTDLLLQLEALSQIYANAVARELTHEAVDESESRFRVLADATPAFIWMIDAQGKFTYLNKRTFDFTGARPEELNGNGWLAYIHPGDRPTALKVFRQGLERREKFVREYRIRRNDGVYRWMLDVGNPRFKADGTFLGFIGSVVDVTDEQLAREVLENVGGQLIAAQEKERTHLARELHDDICQRLAMLSLRIEKVAKEWSNGKIPVGAQLEQIWRQCSDLTGDVQALSHELHPSILDNLGLVMAVRSFCREFSQDNGTTVHFTERDVPNSLPRPVALSLFRVIQEALHNAAKYSGTKHFEVHLQGNPGEIELEVSDQGVGFDVASIKRAEGLGLVSMSERIHLLNGRINIESKPHMGTKIHASVPVGIERAMLATPVDSKRVSKRWHA